MRCKEVVFCGWQGLRGVGVGACLTRCEVGAGVGLGGRAGPLLQWGGAVRYMGLRGSMDGCTLGRCWP